MKRSTDRILSTHIGSLPRPAELLELARTRDRDEAAGDRTYASTLRRAVAEVVSRQAESGLDVVTDGEFGKPSFLHYVNERLGGFEPMDGGAAGPWAGSREAATFPEYYEWAQRINPSPAVGATHMVCTGPITYIGHAALQTDVDNLRAALEGVDAEESFIPAISPSNVEEWQHNRYYATEEEFVFAIADALHEEYKAIVDAGFILQVDDPRLVTYYTVNPEASIEDCRRWARVRVEALNHALRGIAPERVRFHTCYGINMGPRIYDMELKDVADLILAVNAGAYSFEAANPRHEHEWRVWQDVAVPEDKILIPGVITQSTVMVEHPDVVADRIVRFADVVGRENVVAGADCGFATFAGSDEIQAPIVWAKLESLAEGARRATKRLWSGG